MPAVEIAGGLVDGIAEPDGLVFFGIPYAVAPRWAQPVAPIAWSGALQASKIGPSAPQPARAVSLFTHGELPAADEHACLNLNVYTPALEGSLPVLVWIHGGGFTIGHGAATIYDGRRLSHQGIVVVTISYRLGSLGWLAHPELAAGPGAAVANWGLLDQIEALRWVSRNIARFGGDPGKVTAAGQSAGALSVMNLLAAPTAAGLFHRAILQSPPIGDIAQPMETSARWAEALTDLAFPGGHERPGISALHELDAEALVELHEQLLDRPEFRGGRWTVPTVDPVTLPKTALELPGASPRVDVLIGHDAQEGTFFFRNPWRPWPLPERIPGIVARLCPDQAPEEVLEGFRRLARSRGAADDELSLLVEIATDAMVAGPAAQWARARVTELAAQQPSGASSAGVAPNGNVYRYRCEYPGAGPMLGATHTVEVPLIFGTWDDGGPGGRLGGQGPDASAVAETMSRAWRDFISGGSPGWRPLSIRDQGGEVGVFADAGPPRIESASRA